MKKGLFLILILQIAFSYSQNNCVQSDGIFRYQAQLFIENISTDFDKADLINYVIGLEDISNEDLNTLNEGITLVFKTFPSQNPHRLITIFSTIEIDTILASFNNSIESHYCISTDCSLDDGTFSYYSLLMNNNIPNDFDKDDFIDFIVAVESISNEDLATLNTHITSVSKAFPTSQTELLQRVVVVNATTELYAILENLNNTVEHHECNDDDIILEINDNEQIEYSIIYPNPITKDSVIKLNRNFNDIRLELINQLGQIIYHERILGKNIIELKKLPIANGVSFIKIYNLTNGATEYFKIVMQK